MKFHTLAWKGNHLELIDQTLLPARTVYIRCRTMEDVWKAIRNMKVRGAPAIGVTAAFGIYLGAKAIRAEGAAFQREFKKVSRRMRDARPTARNLFDTAERMERVASRSESLPSEVIKKRLLDMALEIQREDERLCDAIGRYGSRLFKSGDHVLTHCNAGALATAGIGTALAGIYTAKGSGKKLQVFATETRPFLQGARLTAWELTQNGVPINLLCDNMVGYLMKLGRIDKVIVGADRIASNGDTANKIGTYAIAELARANGIPFYVAAPSTTFDFSIRTGKEIPIEFRKDEELVNVFGKRIAPEKIGVFNPAFDVTPHQLISGIVTEKGVFRPPFISSLKPLKSPR